MNKLNQSFSIVGQQEDCLLLQSEKALTASATAEVREAVEGCFPLPQSVIYLDTRKVEEMDLSGVNEVIHTHYTLQQRSKKLVFLYRRFSLVERWVKTTGLHRFVETAIID